jgi:hypothetical protein
LLLFVIFPTVSFFLDSVFTFRLIERLENSIATVFKHINLVVGHEMNPSTDALNRDQLEPINRDVSACNLI